MCSVTCSLNESEARVDLCRFVGYNLGLNCGSSGVMIRFRSDGGIFNLRRLKARTKVSLLLLRELLFADDCALIAHTEDELQSILNDFERAAFTLWPHHQHKKNRSDVSAETRQLPPRSRH